jgi:hypothetical protein
MAVENSLFFFVFCDQVLASASQMPAAGACCSLFELLCVLILAAVLAPVFDAPVVAAGRAPVLAVALPEPVLAVARAAVLALVLLAPVLALPFRSPVLTTAKPVVLLAAASTAASVCVLAGVNPARKDFCLLCLLRGWLPKLLY